MIKKIVVRQFKDVTVGMLREANKTHQLVHIDGDKKLITFFITLP